MGSIKTHLTFQICYHREVSQHHSDIGSRGNSCIPQPLWICHAHRLHKNGNSQVSLTMFFIHSTCEINTGMSDFKYRNWGKKLINTICISVSLHSAIMLLLTCLYNGVHFSSCTLCSLYLLTPNPPVILSGNDSISLAPYHTYYPKLEEHMAEVGIGIHVELHVLQRAMWSCLFSHCRKIMLTVCLYTISFVDFCAGHC